MDRAALQLTYLGGYTITEVARRLDLTRAEVSRVLRSAVHQLATRLPSSR